MIIEQKYAITHLNVTSIRVCPHDALHLYRNIRPIYIFTVVGNANDLIQIIRYPLHMFRFQRKPINRFARSIYQKGVGG